MQLPKIAIVGRPNVGKSALFNRIVGKRVSIVDDAEGITRDRIYHRADFFGTPFEVIDTAGLHNNSKEPFKEFVMRQTEVAILEADSLVMVVDALVGPTDLDRDVARLLRKSDKPVTLAVNKIDNKQQEDELLYQFKQLGIDTMVPVSAAHKLNIAELLEDALRELPKDRFEVEEEKGIQVSVVGRANVGKSSFINRLLGEERLVVSDIPGTTRDAIDTLVEFEGERLSFIDTAGIRRVHAEHEVVDKFARIRSYDSIERADVCLLMIDATEGLTHQEKRIISQIEKSGKGMIVLVNKWDLMKDVRMEHYKKALYQEVSFLEHFPLLFLSAKTGKNLEKVFPLLLKVYENCMREIPTPQLNKFIEKSMQRTHPPMIRGKRLRIYYMTQIKKAPPTFALFINYPDLITGAYKRYLLNQFRKTYDFEGVPTPFILKPKKKENKKESG